MITAGPPARRRGAAGGRSLVRPSAPGRPAASEDYNLEAFVAEEKSLADFLADQLGLAVGDQPICA